MMLWSGRMRPVPKGRLPGRPSLGQEKIEAAVLLVKSAPTTPTKAARQTGLERSTPIAKSKEKPSPESLAYDL